MSTLFADTNREARDNLEVMADNALKQSETRTLGALLAIASSIYAATCVLERIEDSLDSINDTLKARLDP